MLENVQFLSENGEAKFAVIDFKEFQYIRDLLSDEDKLQDYLDYLHMQMVKKQAKKRYTLEEVRELCGLGSKNN